MGVVSMMRALTICLLIQGLGLLLGPGAAHADDGFVEPQDDATCQDGPNPMHCAPARCSWCANQGRCAFEQDAGCVVGPKGCKDSPACAVYGRCVEAKSEVDGRPICVAGSEAACAASARCAAVGACGLVPQEAPELAVDDRVQVHREGARCGVTTDAMCKESRACTLEHRCVARDGACVVRSAAVCRASPECRTHGRCQLVDGSCQVESDADCRQSTNCKVYGACVADQGIGVFAPQCRVLDCSESVVCKRFGACDSSDDDRCMTDNPEEPECPAGELVRVPIERVEASSTHRPSGGYRFDAAHLHDGKLDTSWQPSPSKQGGAGAKVTLHLATPTDVVMVRLANGFQRKDALGDLFALNNRASKVYIGLFGSNGHLVDLPTDKRGFTEIPVYAVEEPTKRLTLEIFEVARGARWNDVALSEVEVLRCKSAD